MMTCLLAIPLSPPHEQAASLLLFAVLVVVVASIVFVVVAPLFGKLLPSLRRVNGNSSAQKRRQNTRGRTDDNDDGQEPSLNLRGASTHTHIHIPTHINALTGELH